MEAKKRIFHMFAGCCRETFRSYDSQTCGFAFASYQHNTLYTRNVQVPQGVGTKYLESYLSVTHVPIHRVAAAVELTGLPVDLHPIKTALYQLLNTSLALDHKKKVALQHLRRGRPLHVRLHASILNELNTFVNHLLGRASVADRLGEYSIRSFNSLIPNFSVTQSLPHMLRAWYVSDTI